MSSFTTYHLFFPTGKPLTLSYSDFFGLTPGMEMERKAPEPILEFAAVKAEGFSSIRNMGPHLLGAVAWEEHSFEGACLASGAWVAFHIHRKGQGQGMPGLEEGLLPNCPVLELLDPSDLVVQSPPFLHRKQSSQPAGKVLVLA